MPKAKPIIDPVYPILHHCRTSVDHALQCAMNLEAACQILIDSNAVATSSPATVKLQERMAALRKALFGEDRLPRVIEGEAPPRMVVTGPRFPPHKG